MGSSAYAYLYYGYDLGGVEGDWKLAEYDAEEYSLVLPWYNDEVHDDFVTEAEKHLLRVSGVSEAVIDPYDNEPDDEKRMLLYPLRREAQQALGVDFDTTGHHDYSSNVLYARGSKISVEWSETELLDFEALSRKVVEGDWDAKLANALRLLEITPRQEKPGWLLATYYG